jgi:hypothetical protein
MKFNGELTNRELNFKNLTETSSFPRESFAFNDSMFFSISAGVVF